MRVVRYARTRPGWTWTRRARVYSGIRFHHPQIISYIWVRSPWRVAAVWVAAVAVLCFIGWGLGR